MVRGEYLFCRGEPVQALHRLVEGRLRLERTLPDGTVVTLAVFREGDEVAGASLFSERYHCDARAEIASRVQVFERAQILRRLAEDPARALEVAAGFAAQVRRLRAMVEVRARRRAEDRVLAYLHLLEAMSELWDDSRPLHARASELGLTPEALYRALRRLEANGQVERAGRAVVRLHS